MRHIPILTIVLGLAASAQAGIFIYLDGNDAPAEVTMTSSTSVLISVVSDNTNPYTAYLDLDDPGNYWDPSQYGEWLGPMVIRPAAGNNAAVQQNPYGYPDCWMVTADGNDPGPYPQPGAQFEITYHCKAVGDAVITLYDDTYWNIMDQLLVHQIPKYSGGSGDANDPYQIANHEDLFALAADTNDYNKCFILTADIDLDPNLPGRQVFTTAVVAPDTNNANYGIFDGNAFTGVFDGGAHTISNLKIAAPGTSYVGMFGAVSSPGQIKNMRLLNVDINTTDINSGPGQYVGALVGSSDSASLSHCDVEGGIVQGGYSIGGLAGAAHGVGGINDCHTSCAVEGISYVGGLIGQNLVDVQNCSSGGQVIAYNGTGGGLVGLHESGTLSSSCATGPLYAGNSDSGGLVGVNMSTISNCYCESAISGIFSPPSVGGLVGRSQSGTVVNSFFAGTFVQPISEETGGLVGYYQSGTLMYSFWDINTTGVAKSIGGGYVPPSATIRYCVGLTTAQMKNPVSFAPWACLGLWTIDKNNDYPRLLWEGSSGQLLAPSLFYAAGDGTPDNPYCIANTEELRAAAYAYCDWTKHFRLTADINLADCNENNFNMFGVDPFTNQPYPFKGTFDGAGHTIANFTYTNTQYVGTGLFSYADDPNGEVRNLRLLNPKVSGKYMFTGALAGHWDYGKVTRCCVEGGTVSSTYWGTGGLIGSSGWGSRISQCYSSCTVNSSYGETGGLVGFTAQASLSESYAVGSVKGTQYVGGLVGSIGSTPVTNCFSAGAVVGSQYVGGLVGSKSSSTVTNSFWDVNTSGRKTSAGGVGLSTVQMQTESTFTDAGWDFANIWQMLGIDYPSLVWQEIPTVATPDVAGMLQSDAETAIVAAGLTVGNTTLAFSNTIPQGHIVTQFPEPGAPARLGTRVNLTVSRGALLGGGDGTSENPYRIATPSDWQQLLEFPQYWNKHFLLTNDIDFEGTILTPVGNVTTHFAGVFDGNGYAVRNIIIINPASDYVGLFGFVGEGGQVRNLGIDDVNVSGYRFVGGLVGRIDFGSVTNCYVTGAVTGSDYYVGGLVGRANDANVTACYASGAVTGNFDYVGGLVGYAYDTNVTNSYATGAVTGNYRVGGLVGYAYNDTSVTDSYATGSVTGADDVGGLVGDASQANVTSCYATGAVSGSSYVGGLVGAAYNYTSVSNCHAIGAVTGNGDFIGGLVGLNYGNVTNCYATGAAGGLGSVGGLVGRCFDGSITNCYATGAVGGLAGVGGLVGDASQANVTSCYATGAVSGQNAIGGLVGAVASDSSVTNSWATGTVAGDNVVGGLAGDIWQATVTNCFATGSVSGNSNVGGLMGQQDSGTVTNCFWDVNTSGTSDGVGNVDPDPNGAMGKTTAQMMTLSTFTGAGWDFNNVWAICENTNYPRLQWQIPPADFVCPDGVTFVDYSYLAGRWFWTDYGDVNGLELSGDGKIAGEDFAILANWWGQSACGDCGGADYSGDNNVDSLDLSLLCDNWLFTDYGDCEGAELTADGLVDIDDLRAFTQQWLDAI